jgi:hypothetical protein
VNSLVLILLLVAGGALITLPRRWAPIPLLAVACYVTTGQGMELGSFSLPAYRIMLALGLLRALVRRESLVGGVNSIDRLMLAWAGWVFFASLFHLWEPGSGPKYASGYIFDIALSYFLLRAWCHGLDETKGMLKAIAILLVPVALGMYLEHVLQRNLFSVLGAPEGVYLRDGAIRSRGPFAHPILAGTVGSACVAYMLALWKEHRAYAVIGIVASTSMVLTSNSSGPLTSLMMAIAAVMAWRWRDWMRALRYTVLALYLLLELVMSRPAYYVISKLDLTGSSTGWHRSRLIEAAIEHFSEWWLFGTDHTVHWMGIRTYWSERHSDITNYYIANGVVGGFPAMLLVILMMWRAFSWVGCLVRSDAVESAQDKFVVWCLGAGLFAHAVSSLSIAYSDQSVVFFWLNISIISALYSSIKVEHGHIESTARVATTSGFAGRGRLGSWP